MSDSINALQEKQFGGLNDFLARLSYGIIKNLRDKYGEEAISIIDKLEMDTEGLYRWHLQRILQIIDALKEVYGPEVIGAAAEYTAKSRYDEGAALASERGGNALADIVPVFTFGNDENIVSRSDTEAVIKWQGCPAGRIAHEMGRSDVFFDLYCKSDCAMVSGFNSGLECEHIKTVMKGDGCCVHRIYVK